AAEAQRYRPEAVLSANTPLLAQAALMRRTRSEGARFVFWQQDILSVLMRRMLHERYGRLGGWAGAGLERLERKLLADSNSVVVISPDFVRILEAWGIPPERIAVIENWAPVDDIPVLPKANAWSRAMGLTDTVVYLYSGPLGLKHEADSLMRLADHFRERSDVKIVLVSQGSGAEAVSTQATARQLSNILVLPFQPYETLPEVLATGDVLIALLGA